MAQKWSARPGRPREYDPEIALQRATEAFWDAGFSGTSLDDLSARTGMNRPSLYAAFGDKQALYLETLRRYRSERQELFKAVLSSGRPLRDALLFLYRAMIDTFLSGDRGSRGCYFVATAATEAVLNPEVREILAASWQDLDVGLGKAFAAARERGELDPKADPKVLATMAAAVAHTLALRARAGQSRATLLSVADSAVEFIFPARRAKQSRRRSVR
jgi:AcrR family transcriptional regulator